jgi:hypothetical protein
VFTSEILILLVDTLYANAIEAVNSRFVYCWVELSLSHGRRSVDHFVMVSVSPSGPMTRFYPYLYPFFSDSCLFSLPVGHPLWREDRSVTYSVIADLSGHWGPITIHYRLIWDCVPSSSLLTTRRDYGGGILTRLHMECFVYSPRDSCYMALWQTT